jgi:bifunctional non-homologous end joining protein LigD
VSLSEYEKKRNFKATPEPGPIIPPQKSSDRGGFFCVQRHDASRLHYDFRLEVNGVLVSWAVPKGPSLDPNRKPLAMKVEDHPLDYGTFEGNIPEGNYGGGSVMLWDQGTYDVLGDAGAQEQLDRGDFKFDLHGTKLNGSFAIVHMKPSASRRTKGNEWLLIKKKDEHAVLDYDIDQFAWSVKTRRTQAEIASDTALLSPKDLPGAKEAALPASVEPMLASIATKPPSGDQWLYEIKWDGVRALCKIHSGKLEILSRRGLRCEQQYPELADLPAHINVKEAWLDGEIAVLDEKGRSRFALIQPRISANKSALTTLQETNPATLFLFDLLYADGYDLRAVPLEERKRLLAYLVTPAGHIRLSEAFDTDGDQMFEAARAMGLEGLIAKDRTSHYSGSRGQSWQKMKVNNEQEFVIAGFTAGEREFFGALVLAVNEDGKLRHVGQVGTGFDHKLMKSIYSRLEPLITETSPLSPKPKIKGVTWVKPELVCQVRYLEWTPDNNLRAPVLIGLREDKPREQVVREHPAPAPSNGVLNDLLGGKDANVKIDGHSLKFTNLDKLYFPKDGWKKRDLLRFYDEVSEFLVPHLKDRPLSMKRYPNGIAADYFFQKNATHFPEWMHLEPIEESEKLNHYPTVDNRAGLLYLVNLGCIDQNPLMSRMGHLDKPDWMLLDLDPVEASYDLIVDAALLLREILAELGLQGYAKTTGGDGMHLYVPLDPIYTFEQVRNFAEILSHLAVDRAPNLFTTPRSVEKRKKNRVYFDYLQIGSGKTISSPYVVRAYNGAPVATPLAWDEVKHGLKPTHFRIDNTIARFQKFGDIFAPVLAGGQRLETALKKLT